MINHLGIAFFGLSTKPRGNLEDYERRLLIQVKKTKGREHEKTSLSPLRERKETELFPNQSVVYFRGVVKIDSRYKICTIALHYH